MLQLTRPARILLSRPQKSAGLLLSLRLRPKSHRNRQSQDEKTMKRVNRGRVLQHLYYKLPVSCCLVPTLSDAGSAVAYKAEEDFESWKMGVTQNGTTAPETFFAQPSLRGGCEFKRIEQEVRLNLRTLALLVSVAAVLALETPCLIRLEGCNPQIAAYYLGLVLTGCIQRSLPHA